MDYGNLRMKKGKTKSVYTFKGNFSIRNDIGNEKLASVEIRTGSGGLLVKNTYAFCEFMKAEKLIWPEMMKASNMPHDNSCPLPSVSFD